MTSRERVERAVSFRKPDRIPIDLGAIRASGINAVVYDRMKKRMGIDTPTRIHDSLQVLAEVEMEVLDRLGCDVIPLDVGDWRWAGPGSSPGVEKELFCGQRVWFPPGTDIRGERDGSWSILERSGKPYARMPKDGYYFDYLRPTMAERRIDPGAFRPPDSVSDEELRFLEARSRHLYENTDKAVLGWGASISLMGLSTLMSDNITQGSLDEWLCMLMTEKETANEMMGRYVDSVIKCMELYHQAVGDRCFGWGAASDDAGTQRGELLSPGLFSEMIKPHYSRLCDWMHSHTKWKTYLHSCGSIYNYIGEWIDAGSDIINPVQVSAANMEPGKLMAEFGGRIVFWGGGCDTQRVLPRETPQEVREEVRHNISAFGAGDGGYVFTQVHNIQQDVPVENVEAMFAAAREFGADVRAAPEGA